MHHQHARAWFERHHPEGWATTPFTEAGFVRVSSNRAAIPTPASPAGAVELLGRLTAFSGYRFWADDMPTVVGPDGDPALMLGHRDVTDGRLLALAVRRRGRLVTLDRRISRLLGGHDPLTVDIIPA